MLRLAHRGVTHQPAPWSRFPERENEAGTAASRTLTRGDAGALKKPRSFFGVTEEVSQDLLLNAKIDGGIGLGRHYPLRCPRKMNNGALRATLDINRRFYRGGSLVDTLQTFALVGFIYIKSIAIILN